MTSANASEGSFARMRSHTLLYVRGTLGIRRIRSKYVVVYVVYTHRPNYCFGHVNRFINVYERIKYISNSYVYHTHGIRWIRKTYS